MQDYYSHIQNNVFYIVANIMGPVERSVEYEEILNDFNSQLADHCNCNKVCTLSCKCLENSCGANYIQYRQGGLLQYKLYKKKETMSIFECNENCLCDYDCSNRLVQRGPIVGLEIRHCKKGLGLYTTCSIPKGTFVCEYAGELITKSQAAARHKINALEGKMNYIFCLKEHSGDSVVATFVDPSVFGNIGRYINHSCEPNCHIVPVRCDSLVPKLAIFTKVDILKNEELTFHYGVSDARDQSELNRIVCLCNSANCSGFMPFCDY